MSPEEIKNTIAGIGAAAELTELYFSTLVKRGMSEYYALELTKEFIRIVMTKK